MALAITKAMTLPATKIDFYILQSDSEQACIRFTCRLAEKALRQGNQLTINAASASQADALDAALWNYKAESYLPHSRINNQQADDEQVNNEQSNSEQPNNEKLNDEPIVVTHGSNLSDISKRNNHVLINLGPAIPKALDKYERLAQIVDQTPNNLAASRQNFASLKQQGYHIDVNKLSY